jgi:hypothetical protein
MSEGKKNLIKISFSASFSPRKCWNLPAGRGPGHAAWLHDGFFFLIHEKRRSSASLAVAQDSRVVHQIATNPFSALAFPLPRLAFFLIHDQSGEQKTLSVQIETHTHSVVGAQ